MRFFALGFFHESSSPKPLKKTLVSFRLCSKIHGDIRKSWCTISINDIGEHRRQILPPVSLVPLISTIQADVNDTSGKFATGINGTSSSGGKICRRCR
jgi:hypothetical protein